MCMYQHDEFILLFWDSANKGSSLFFLHATDPPILQSYTVIENFAEVGTICNYDDVFDELQLVCSASKPSEVPQNLTVTWFEDGMIVDGDYEQSSGGAIVTRTLSFNDSSFGENYTCVAEIVIPQSPTVTNSSTRLFPSLGELKQKMQKYDVMKLSY